VRGFDPSLPSDLAASDLCVRLRRLKAGRCVYEPSSVVVHRESHAARRGRDLPAAHTLGIAGETHTASTHREGMGRLLHGVAREGNRHREAAHVFSHHRVGLRWAIKIAPCDLAVRDNWGDFHFATALKHALMRAGHDAVIDCQDAWYRPTSDRDDVVLVLRGLSRYRPDPRHVNLVWLLSHPDLFSAAETEAYDHVFVASDLHAQHLANHVDVPVTTLLQATDPQRFGTGPTDAPRHEVLFVGNSRKVYRPVVRHAVEAGLPLSVYGMEWEGLLPPGVLKGTHIPNEKLGEYYRAAGVVLNDHWGDMRANGFLSNRLWDAAACGAVVVSDGVNGMTDVFGDNIYVYTTGAAELRDLVRSLLSGGDEKTSDRHELAQRIATEHTFDRRVCSLTRAVAQLAEERGADTA
jgi:hypothetical protein